MAKRAIEELRAMLGLPEDEPGVVNVLLSRNLHGGRVVRKAIT